MSLGLCCQFLEPVVKRDGSIEYKNSSGEEGLQHGQFLKNKYSKEKIQQTWVNNCKNLLLLLKKIHLLGIKVFRFSSNLLPLFDCVDPEYHNHTELLVILNDIGEFVKVNNIRLSSHPDQFSVLSSDNQKVIDNSFKILSYHAWIMDQMKLDLSPYYAINIHGGKKGNSNILIDSINKLPNNVKSRLTLENDERSYNVSDLLKVYSETHVPVLFDSHHHTFNDALMTIEEGLELCKTTWNNIKPLTHLSNTEPGLEKGNFTERRKHSNYVHYIPECQRLDNNQDKIDIELEFKMKNIALFKCVKDFEISL